MMLSDKLVAEDRLQLIQVLVREAHGDHLLNLEWILAKNYRLLKHANSQAAQRCSFLQATSKNMVSVAV